MARHKDVNWSLPDRVSTCDQASVAVLQDIRDELKRMNTLLHCHNFTQIPYILRMIRRNTVKTRRKRKK